MDNNAQEFSKIYSQEPVVNINGISVIKRCLQLFDPQYQKALDRKADLVINKEKTSNKDFDKFSTLKKLKIVDK